MKPGSFQSLAGHLILGLSILLLFMMIFDPWLTIPGLLWFAGRFHPVILHFPIVLVILTVINSFTRHKHYQEILLPSAALFSLVSAITGFILKEENQASGELLTSHQWMGSSLALLMAVWYGIENTRLDLMVKKGVQTVTSALSRVALIVLIIVTGHLGGKITHGENFLSLNRTESRPVPEDPLVFEHLILPVLETKCQSCHNENKSKGGLILKGYASLMKGGESGVPVSPGNPEASELIRRIHLPADDEKHMPPSQEPQLTSEEISLLEGWINMGSREDLRVSMVPEKDSFYTVIMPFIPTGEENKWENLPEIDESTINRLSSDYYTIRRLAGNSNALSVMVQPHAGYATQRLNGLDPLKDNIVELDLSFLPLQEDEMRFISACQSIERLEIDFTTVDDELFSLLKLDNLRILKAQGSRLTGKSSDKILSLENLEKLYVWNTGFTQELSAGRSGLEINTGIDQNIEFTSVLPVPVVNPNQPFFVSPFEIQFEHPLKDIDIYFSFDEKTPLKESQFFENPILISESCKIRFMAAREGWSDSPVDSVIFFKTKEMPDRVLLAGKPHNKYPGKGEITLFDLEKGSYNLQDSAWLGFQNEKMELECHWDSEVVLNEILLSSFVNTAIHVFPPVLVEVSYGKGSERRILGSYKGAPAGPDEKAGFRYIRCSIKPEPVTELTVSVTPLQKLPAWHNDKGKPGWFFVDEVLLVD